VWFGGWGVGCVLCGVGLWVNLWALGGGCFGGVGFFVFFLFWVFGRWVCVVVGAGRGLYVGFEVVLWYCWCLGGSWCWWVLSGGLGGGVGGGWWVRVW